MDNKNFILDNTSEVETIVGNTYQRVVELVNTLKIEKHITMCGGITPVNHNLFMLTVIVRPLETPSQSDNESVIRIGNDMKISNISVNSCGEFEFSATRDFMAFVYVFLSQKRYINDATSTILRDEINKVMSFNPNIDTKLMKIVVRNKGCVDSLKYAIHELCRHCKGEVISSNNYKNLMKLMNMVIEDNERLSTILVSSETLNGASIRFERIN